jgi:putative tricarboxylic transport membrane protein
VNNRRQRPIELGRDGARIANIALSAIFVAIGTILLITALTTLRYMAAEGPGPGFLPIWASLIFVAGSIVLLVQSWRGAYSKGGPIILHLRPAAAYLATLVASVLLIPLLGLLGSVFVFFLAAAIVVERCPLWQGLIIGAGLTLALHLLFVELMRIPLPTGLLPLP